MEQAVPTGVAQALHDGVLVAKLASVGAQAVSLQFKRLTGFLKRFLEGSANGHHLSNRLHLQAEFAIASSEFVKVPARDLHHHVVERRLEHCRRVAGDLVLEFVEVVPNGQLGRHLRDGVPRRFGRQRRRARHPRVDFNRNDVLVLVGRHRELDVATSGEVSDAAHHLDGHVPHALERGVTQGHGRRHRDAVPRVDAHRVKVLDGADKGHVVVGIAKKLKLKFLPAQQRLVDHHLVNRAQVEAPLQLVLEGIFVVHHSRAGTPQGGGRADAQGVTKLLRHLLAFQEALGRGLRCHGDINLSHEFAEGLPVLCDVDGLGIHPNHAHVVFFPNAHFLALNGEIQSRLPAHGGKHRIDVGVPFEDGHDGLRLERLEVDMVCDDRVGHDGRRVRIDEGDFDAFLLEAAGSVAPRVVEFTGLSNDNRSASDDEDRLDAVVFGHFFFIRVPFSLSESGIRARTRRPNVVDRGQN